MTLFNISAGKPIKVRLWSDPATLFRQLNKKILNSNASLAITIRSMNCPDIHNLATVLQVFRQAEEMLCKNNDIQAFLRSVVVSMQTALQAGFGGIVVYNASRNEAVLHSISTCATDKEDWAVSPLGSEFAMAPIQHAELYFVNEISVEPPWCHLLQIEPSLENLVALHLKPDDGFDVTVILASQDGINDTQPAVEELFRVCADQITHILHRNQVLHGSYQKVRSLAKLVMQQKGLHAKQTIFANRLKYLINNHPAIIYSAVPSGDFRITYISENVQELLGYGRQEVLSEPDFWFNCIHRDDINNIFSRLPYLFTEGQQIHEYRFRDKTGKYQWMHDTMRLIVDENGEPVEVVGSLKNIDDRKEVEKVLRDEKEEQKQLIDKLKETQHQLVQSEKMASIGQLAAGVAHEINNPIGFVNSNMGTLKNYIKNLLQLVDKYQKMEPLIPDENLINILAELKQKIDLEFIREDIEILLDQSGDGLERVKHIVLDLKDFSRVDQEEWQWVDIHQGIDSTLNIANNELKYVADVIKEYGELPEVECIPSQLNQVFMNLMVNAAQAIKDYGTITIRTGTRGDRVWLEFIDTGTGIAEADMKKLFDPFYTTKAVGQGTGLGLSLSYGIINSHHGSIEVDSEIGKGTTFRIELPVSQTRKE